MKPFQKIINCIKNNQNFVLQGGAGSGKTETLKEVIEYISDDQPEAKIACITLTNLAADEIKNRVGDKYTVTTIHSFLNSLIHDYKKNIHEVIYEIFKIPLIEREELLFYDGEEKLQKKAEHDKYKKVYEKYSKILFSMHKISSPKVTGKPVYDKDPLKFNAELNDKINILNTERLEIINESSYDKVGYNETRFDSFRDLTYGHDTLLVVASLLFEKFELLGRILSDKFDFLFIDEYQDTRENVIDIVLNRVPKQSQLLVGLFGDSMQGIYDDGIGSVQKYIDKGQLEKVEKTDNYRCSDQVIQFINKLRDDGLEQEVALKTINGKEEELADRQGEVELYYYIFNSVKPHVRSPLEDKNTYTSTLLKVIQEVEKKNIDYKKLMLTNKSISIEVGFKKLYSIFDSRYVEVKEEIEKLLQTLQLSDLVELYQAYTGKDKSFNYILSNLKKAGFEFVTMKDKVRIKDLFDKIVGSDFSAYEALEFAYENKLLSQSESSALFLERRNKFMEELAKNEQIKPFKKYYFQGENTFTKMGKCIEGISNQEFDDFKRILIIEKFYTELLSKDLKFSEIVSYYGYLNEETQYITMHKTKGSGIDNVMIVLDEYFWTKYNFKSIYDADAIDDTKRLKNLKLFYVACSRAIKNLKCIRIITSEEKDLLLGLFPNAIEVSII